MYKQKIMTLERLQTFTSKLPAWDCDKVWTEVYSLVGYIPADEDEVSEESLAQSETKVDADLATEALAAIVARIKGEWDNPQLLKWQELNEDPLVDILGVAQSTLDSIGNKVARPS